MRHALSIILGWIKPSVSEQSSRLLHFEIESTYYKRNSVFNQTSISKLLQNHFVNGVDNTIAGKNISFDYIWDTSVVLDFDIVTALNKGDFLPTKGFQNAFALFHCCSRKLARNNMPGKIINRFLWRWSLKLIFLGSYYIEQGNVQTRR